MWYGCDVADRTPQGRSRQDYLDRLQHDLCEYYGYNDYMMEKLVDIFGPKEVCGQPPNRIRQNRML
jgi:hypothetical protein